MLRNRYETTFLGAPTLTEEENAAIVTALEGTITEGKGTLIRTEPWGKRRLAYRVQKFDEGYYTLLFYEAEPSVVHELERRIRLNENLLRFLTVKVDWEEKVARAAALKAARRRPASEAAPEEIGYGEDVMETGEFEGGEV
jgi:small subunit ribosomal protein S6